MSTTLNLALQHPMGPVPLSSADPVFTPDVNAASVFPKDSPHLTPLAIVGDGNCLPRCTSILVYGDQVHHTEMRARIILELILVQECSNCLPRCTSVLVYGDQGHHTEMRARIILELVLVQECSNCLPRCASVLVYGDQEHHTEMRARITPLDKFDSKDWSPN